MLELFENVNKDFNGPQGHNEHSYTFYNRSSRPEICEIRRRMEEWFQAYPDAEKDDLGNTFKNDFDAGFFELFLFTLFNRMGYTITIHPQVPESNKTPDFLVSGFGQEFYLEAKVSYYDSEEERARKRMLGSLYEIIDKAQILDYFIYLREVKAKSKRQPRANDIRRAIEACLVRYDVAALYDTMNNGMIATPPCEVYEDEDVYIEFCPIPKSPDGRGQKHRAIGMYGEEPKVLENVESLRKAFKMKASRYGALDRPYLVAVNAIDMVALDTNDVLECLFGRTYLETEMLQHTGVIQESRGHDGFFTGREDQGQNTRVSAVFITKINPSNWLVADYWIMEHPKARRPVSLRTSSLVTRFIENSVIYRTPGTSFGEIIK